MSGEAGIIMSEVLVTVESECSVAVSSLGEGECHPPFSDPTSDLISDHPTTESTTTDNTAIIGGSVVVVILIMHLQLLL